MSRASASAASTLLLGVALALVAFGAAGGTELGRTTLTELLLVLGGAAVVAAAALAGRGGPLHGVTSLVAFGVLAAMTAFSIGWSIAPELSYVEAGRTLAYLVVFAGAIGAARLAPRAAPAVLGAVLLAASAVVAYALASRVWPAELAADELSNRIGAPYGYWNAVGTTAALALPAGFWLAARRSGPTLLRALAYPALAAAFVGIMLSQSRGALLAAALAALAWFALVPLRLRSLPALVLPALAAAPVCAWALSEDAFSKAFQPLSVKQAVAGELGAFLALMLAGSLLAGLAATLAMERAAPSPRLRRRIGVAALAAACMLPLAGLAAVALSERGLTGTVEQRFEELTSESDTAPAEGAARFAAASSVRSALWREADKVFDDRPALGTGAGTFAIARLRYRKTEQVSRHAHGFVAQTLADTGLVGAAGGLALLVAWLVAAARTTRLLPRRRHPPGPDPPPRPDWSADRVALVALALVAIAFGLQSAIDWTWFVPGPAVMALVAAGFVAGRGPEPAARSADGFVAGRGPEPAAPTAADGERARRLPVRIALAAGSVVAALLCAWAIWQPEASNRASDEALALAERGELEQAAAEARRAEDINPLSPKPLLVLAAIETARGDDGAAERTLERAVRRFPDDPQTWLRLASFELATLDRPDAALRTVGAVLQLDPRSKAGNALLLRARARLEQKARGA